MHAIQTIEAELSACHENIAEMIAKGEELPMTHWTCGHQGPGPGDEYVGPDVCDTCLLDMKLQLLKLSRLLSDKDLRTAYKTRIFLTDRVDKG